MIHPLLDEDAWCYWVISVGALLSFVGLIAACICSCRRNENKNEFLGLAGMVTLKHSENEGFNGLPAVDVPQIVTQDAVDSAKRATTANRSLPDIPKDKSGDRRNELGTESQDIYETTEVTGDQSELYATVQDKGEWKGTVDGQREERGEIAARKSAINQDNDVHYQYARFPSTSPNKDEHPYAQLKNVEKVEINQPRDRTNGGQPADSEKPSTSVNQAVGNPVAPPRARRSSSHNSLHVMDSACNIQAANAISGGVQANQDLPYMTPPLLTAFPYTAQTQRNNSPQQHFSGDSQDSKGYTSISVREPLANIMAQTKAVSQQHQTIRPLVDSHYTTVSDDSDEMYAAIDEQDKVYTSGSDTYAQIQPASVEVPRTTQNDHVLVHGQSSSRAEETHHPAPQPPSVDSLRHVAHAHSRQASSSSATSSIIIPGSPKPEKRQANSPLPPPPPPPPQPPTTATTATTTTTEQSQAALDGIAEVYAFVDKKAKTEDRAKCQSTGKSLEDMYAKVMKKKKDEHTEDRINCTQALANDISACNATKNFPTTENSRRISSSSHDSAEFKRETDLLRHNGINCLANFDASADPFDAVFDAKELEDLVGSDHGYEAVNSLSRENSSKVPSNSASICEPDYETLRPQSTASAAKASKSTADDRVETLGSLVNLKHRQVSNASSEDPGYERVRLNSRLREVDHDTDSEPNYESMPHDVGEPNYASVCRPGDSDTDPNYESVGHGDPNYESVKYMSLVRGEEPPYEQVSNRNRSVLPPADDYEIVNARTRHSDYEKIARNQPDEQRNTADTDDEQYVQV